MRFFKISICILICTLILASCGNSKNAEYFKELVSNNVAEEIKYMPKLLAGYDAPDEIAVTAQNNTVTYLLKGSVKSKNKLVYQLVNAHIQKHGDGKNIEQAINSVIDNYATDEKNTVKAVKHEFDGKNYAISYEIRPDLDIVRLTVIFAASENVSAFYTLEIKDIEEINDKFLDDICEDTEIIKL